MQCEVWGDEHEAALHEFVVALVVIEGLLFFELRGAGEVDFVVRTFGDAPCEDTACEASAALTDHADGVAGGADAGSDDVLGFFGNAEAAEQKGAGDADGAFVGLAVVVEAVLAGDKRGSVGFGGDGHTFDGFDEGSEFLFIVGVAHAEVVENGDALGVGAHRDELADALIDAGAAHEMRVRFAPLGEDGEGEGYNPGTCHTSRIKYRAMPANSASASRHSDSASTKHCLSVEGTIWQASQSFSIFK